ncbi:SusC/RagA family TonB-linked outer membrane protein [uncultured Bacteroides sp.]|uniref:SusC/RagA family TonB-linked outer membrane protein n=1 Tax=uncultured Bacteroides sp. TaxID=162156 RepID=UPI002AAC10F1|nr:SusC/RagA family TonB-linked outer membrane protein [uncultured Bacteroides sp.]
MQNVKATGKRFFIIAFLLVLLVPWKSNLSAQDYARKRVTLDMTSESVKKLFDEIKNQTGLNFIYNFNLTKDIPSVTIQCDNETVANVLDRILSNSRYTYKIEENFVTVVKQKEAKLREMSGIVRDQDGMELPGVNVYIKNTNYHSITDANGCYTINIPCDACRVSFSYIGMKTSDINVRLGDSSLNKNVALADNGILDEVVVTGYQILNKRSLTSAVTSIKAEDLLRSDVNSIDQMFEGKIPDMIVSSNSGEIGVAPKIRIRGTSTLIGNREPLWVVDGIVVKDPVEISPEELNDPDYVNRIGNAIAGINPQDIERIDVLKDAAATAIYGVKAANGVIVITTKRGYKGKAQVSYNMNVNYKRRPRYSDRSVDVMSSKERVQFSRELAQDHYLYSSDINLVGYEGLLNKLYNNEINNEQFNSSVAKLEAQNTDWFDILCRDSWSSQQTASLSGGSEKSRYYASLGYNKENDVIKSSDSERYTASMHLDNTFSKFLTASFSITGYNYKRNNRQSSINPVQYAYQTSRTIPCYDENGHYYYYQKKISSTESYKYNIQNELDNSANTQEISSFTVNANLGFTFTDWLRGNAIVSYTNQNTNIESYWGDKVFYASSLRYSEFGETIEEPSISLMPQGGELTQNSTRDRNYTVRLQLDANKYFGRDNVHHIDATVGMEMYHDKYTTYKNVTRGYYPDRGKTFVPNIDPTVYTSYAAWLTSNVPVIKDNLTKTLSSYASFTYAYNNMFRINLNGRVDGSNKFGDRSNDKFLPIWSLSGSLDLKRIGLFNYKWIDYMNLKSSYGYQGNMLNDQSPTMSIKKGSMNAYYNSYYSTIHSYPNPNLKWEITQSYNLGMDMLLLNNRLGMEISFFYKKTENAFMTKRISSINGIESYVINGGDLANKGYSFDITYTPLRSRDFRWTLSTSISKIINSLNSFPDAQTYELSDFLNGTALVKGKSVNTFYSYRFLGLSTVDGGPIFDDYQNNVSDLYGLSKYDTYTLVLEASGKRDPNIQGNLTNTFRYKNWHANINMAYSLGAKTRLFAMYGSAVSDNVYSSDIRPDRNYSRDYLRRWQNPGDENKTNIPAIIPSTSGSYTKYNLHYSIRPTYQENGQPIARSAWEMYDYSNIRVVSADYLKLQSISATYEFDKKWLSHLKLERLALTLSGYNLFTICDPALKGQTPTQGGFTTIQLSERPSFSFGVNVIF